MNKIKLCGVSLCTLLTATGANAAGYTCEELIEYTSCSAGYYLNKTVCPDGYTYSDDWCSVTGWWESGVTQSECESMGESYMGSGCVKVTYREDDSGSEWPEYEKVAATISCTACPAGSSCNGGTDMYAKCPAGTYQPSNGQTSCLTTPAGNTSGVGAVNYNACPAGTYQPQSGQPSCLVCPEGSYCGGTGLVAPTAECAIGSYALSGASACSLCPTTGLIDKEGNSVAATTVSTGATSPASCIIDPDALFADDKGTYHFKTNCVYDMPATWEEICAALEAKDPRVDCDNEEGPCGPGGYLLYDLTTGVAKCVNDWEYGGLDHMKSRCASGGGTWNATQLTCMCPGGKDWTSIDGSGRPDGEGGLGCWTYDDIFGPGNW